MQLPLAELNLHNPGYLIEQNQTKIQSNTNSLIGFSNQTKSNIYFAVSSIIEPIERNQTQSNSILYGIHLLTPENK